MTAGHGPSMSLLPAIMTVIHCKTGLETAVCIVCRLGIQIGSHRERSEELDGAQEDLASHRLSAQDSEEVGTATWQDMARQFQPDHDS